MITKFVEVSNGPRNWGKFMLGRFDEEWQRPSQLPDTLGVHSLLAQRGWTAKHLLVLDLETGEGAVFLPGGSAKADLDKHRIWVCPLFEPFLEWLYNLDSELQAQASVWVDVLETLPAYVDLPDAEFALSGYRRPGPEEPLAQIRAWAVQAHELGLVNLVDRLAGETGG